MPLNGCPPSILFLVIACMAVIVVGGPCQLEPCVTYHLLITGQSDVLPRGLRLIGDWLPSKDVNPLIDQWMYFNHANNKIDYKRSVKTDCQYAIKNTLTEYVFENITHVGDEVLQLQFFVNTRPIEKYRFKKVKIWATVDGNKQPHRGKVFEINDLRFSNERKPSNERQAPISASTLTDSDFKIALNTSDVSCCPEDGSVICTSTKASAVQEDEYFYDF